jgi:hypothetical protein
MSKIDPKNIDRDYDALIGFVLQQAETAPVATRIKVLRGLSQILTEDRTVANLTVVIDNLAAAERLSKQLLFDFQNPKPWPAMNTTHPIPSPASATERSARVRAQTLAEIETFLDPLFAALDRAEQTIDERNRQIDALESDKQSLSNDLALCKKIVCSQEMHMAAWAVGHNPALCPVCSPAPNPVLPIPQNPQSAIPNPQS